MLGRDLMSSGILGTNSHADQAASWQVKKLSFEAASIQGQADIQLS